MVWVTCLALLTGCGREVRNWVEVRRMAAGAELRIECADPALARVAERATREWNFGGRLVAGGFDDPEMSRWMDRLGVATAHGRRFLGDTAFGGSDDLLIACFEDPDHAGLPLTLFIGGADISRAWLAESRPLSRQPSLRVIVAHETAFTAQLTRRGSLIESERRSVAAARESLRAAFRSHPLEGPLAKHAALQQLSVRIGPGLAPRDANEYLAFCAKSLDRARAWCDSGEPVLQLDIAAHVDDYARLGGLDDLGAVDPTGHLIASLLADGLPNDRGAALAEAVARRTWGPPADRIVGLAFGLAASNACWGKPLEAWNVDGALGPLESAVQLARHFAHLADSGDLQGLQALWRSGTETLTATNQVAGDEGAAPLPTRDRKISDVQELRGVVLEPPPVPLRESHSFERDLRLASKFGANGLSVTCSFMVQDPLPDRIGDLDPMAGRTRQGDALLAATLAHARELGLTHQTLRPKLFDSDSGEESARRKRTTRPEWLEFFERYQRSIRHAALLAELTGVDLLCIGETLGGATRTEVEDRTGLAPDVLDAKRDGWRGTAQVARSRFGGDLTYLADWPKEAQRLAFWDEFDVVSLSWFPALQAGGPNDSEAAELKRLLYGQLSLMDRFVEGLDKPFVVLACGLPSTELAWKDATVGAGAADRMEQARLYAGLAWALDGASKRLAGFNGIALTGFGVEPGDAERSDRALGRPAELDLKQILAGGRDAE